MGDTITKLIKSPRLLEDIMNIVEDFILRNLLIVISSFIYLFLYNKKLGIIIHMNDESEFEKCSLEEMYIDNFYAPFVKESKVKIGLKLVEEITINSNNTILIVGRVTKIKTRNELIEEDGSLKFEELDTVCISGLDSYYSTKKIAKYHYAKRNELPKKW